MAMFARQLVRRSGGRFLQALPNVIVSREWAAGLDAVDVTVRPVLACTAQPWTQARGFSEELRVVASTLSEGEYHRVADDVMEHMVERLEEYVEENDVDGGDVEYSQGVLTVKLGKLGTFVINKQTPNRQIWLSSPVSGPFRFDHAEGRWLYHRDRRDLVRQLEEEIGGLVGTPLRLE